MVGNRSLLNREVGQVFHLRHVPIHHGGVNLKGQAYFPAGAHAVHRLLPGPVHTPEHVMNHVIDAVQADSHGGSPGIFQPFGHFSGKQGAVGAENRPQPLFPGMVYQGINIFTH
jgi:hypothetical protein